MKNKNKNVPAPSKLNLLRQICNFIAGKRFARRFKQTIHLVDSTTIQLIASCMDWAKHRRRKAAAKCHLRLDLQSFLPRFAIVDTARHNDAKRTREVCAGIKAGEIVIFDKAYVDFAHLADLTMRLIFWVTRAKDNLSCKVVRRCQCGCGKIALAPLPAQLIPGSKLGVGLAVFILLSKYDDHLALYTLERIFQERHRVAIARQQMVQWIEHIAGLLRLIVDRMWGRMKQGSYLQIDETPVRVLDPEVKGKAAKGYLWFYYEAALEGNRQALWFIGRFRELYRIEDEVREVGLEERQAVRHARAPQIWAEMKTRAEELKAACLPKSSLGKAVVKGTLLCLNTADGSHKWRITTPVTGDVVAADVDGGDRSRSWLWAAMGFCVSLVMRGVKGSGKPAHHAFVP